MNLFQGLFSSNATSDNSANDIFPFPVLTADYVKSDVRSLLKRIISDTISRTKGLSEKAKDTINDSYIGVNNEGLVTILSDAIYGKSEVVIYYNPATSFLAVADAKQAAKIREDYKTKGSSPDGVIISFKSFEMTTMLKTYSTIEWNSLASLFKVVNLSRAIQYKMSKMRESVGAKDSSEIVNQAKEIVKAVGEGKAVFIDNEDQIMVPQVDISPTEKALEFVAKRKAEITGMPMAYITGDQTSGMNSNGEGDDKAIEKGLRYYFDCIIKPLFKELFNIDVKFDSNNMDKVTQGLEALKTFELIENSQLITSEEKRAVVEKLFDL